MIEGVLVALAGGHLSPGRYQGNGHAEAWERVSHSATTLLAIGGTG